MWNSWSVIRFVNFDNFAPIACHKSQRTFTHSCNHVHTHTHKYVHEFIVLLYIACAHAINEFYLVLHSVAGFTIIYDFVYGNGRVWLRRRNRRQRQQMKSSTDKFCVFVGVHTHKHTLAHTWLSYQLCRAAFHPKYCRRHRCLLGCRNGSPGEY